MYVCMYVCMYNKSMHTDINKPISTSCNKIRMASVIKTLSLFLSALALVSRQIALLLKQSEAQ